MSTENFDNLSKEELIARLTKAEDNIEKIFKINKNKDVSFLNSCQEVGRAINYLEELIEPDTQKYDDFSKRIVKEHKESHKSYVSSYISSVFEESSIFPFNKAKLDDLTMSAYYADITEGGVYAKAIIESPDTYGKIALNIIERAGRYDPQVYHYDDGRDYDHYPEDPKYKPELFKETVQYFLDITVNNIFDFGGNIVEASKGMGILSQVLKTESYEHNFDDEKFFEDSIKEIAYSPILSDCIGVVEIAKQGILPVDLNLLSTKSFIDTLKSPYEKDGGISRFNNTMKDIIAPLAKAGVFNEELKSNKKGFLHTLKNDLPENLKPEMDAFLVQLNNDLKNISPKFKM